MSRSACSTSVRLESNAVATRETSLDSPSCRAREILACTSGEAFSKACARLLCSYALCDKCAADSCVKRSPSESATEETLL